MSTVKLTSGQTLTNVHSPEQCAGEYCCIHKPSNHKMRDWVMYLRETGLMERLCPAHGTGHPDPDSLAFFESLGLRGYDVHGCCGCCS